MATKKKTTKNETTAKKKEVAEHVTVKEEQPEVTNEAVSINAAVCY